MTKIPLNGVWVLFTAEMLKKEWRVAIIMIQEQDQDIMGLCMRAGLARPSRDETPRRGEPELRLINI